MLDGSFALLVFSSPVACRELSVRLRPAAAFNSGRVALDVANGSRFVGGACRAAPGIVLINPRRRASEYSLPLSVRVSRQAWPAVVSRVECLTGELEGHSAFQRA